MYIPAVPLTPASAAYVAAQREHFLQSLPPPDFPQNAIEASFVLRGGEADIAPGDGRRAMGLEKLSVPEGASAGEREAIEIANRALGFE